MFFYINLILILVEIPFLISLKTEHGITSAECKRSVNHNLKLSGICHDSAFVSPPSPLEPPVPLYYKSWLHAFYFIFQSKRDGLVKYYIIEILINSIENVTVIFFLKTRNHDVNQSES